LHEATYEAMPLILVSDSNQFCTSTGQLQLKQSVLQQGLCTNTN